MTMGMKYLSIASMLFFAQTAYCGTMGAADVAHYDGLYAGADLGLSNLNDKLTTSIQFYDIHRMSATGIVGGGLLGYDYSITDRYKIGLEGFINANGLNVSSREFYAPYSVYAGNARYNTGIRVLPGYAFLPDVIGHILLGYSNARLHAQDNGDFGYLDQTYNKSGFQCGLGMKAPIWKQLSIRADVLYANYGSISSIGGSNNASFAYQNYQNNFSTLEGDLTLAYKFTY